MPPERRATLIYGYDPLCGWCYAQHPQMLRFQERCPEVAIELRCGGLVVGARVHRVALDRDYLVRGLQQVRALTGVEAGPDFYTRILEPGTYVSDSEPPCRAIATMLRLRPDAAYRFAAGITVGYYRHGKAPDHPQHLGELARAEGVDADEFLALWQSDELRRATQKWFVTTRAAGITSYPTLIYADDSGEPWLVGTGFIAADDIIHRIKERV
jgi:putative protein-disulfide isomerase